MTSRGGYEVEHATLRSCVAAIELPRRYPVPFLCPSCRVTHVNKTVHLWLDDRGKCIVSAGVLAELKSAGMPGLTQTGFVPDPPALMVGVGRSREQADYENRAIRPYKQ